MKWRPLRSNCIVEVKKEKETTDGGIYIPKEIREKEDMAREEGIVLAMGPDFFIDSDEGNKDQVKVGDRVAFARYGGKTLGEDGVGRELRIMRDIDILAVKIEE
jgi:chaperonin GroES